MEMEVSLLRKFQIIFILNIGVNLYLTGQTGLQHPLDHQVR
jgi:hypothetical protein